MVLHVRVLQSVPRLMIWGRELLMQHACLADEAGLPVQLCVCRTYSEVY